MRSARCGLEVRSARLGGGGRRPWPAHPPASRQVCAASVRAAGARRRRQLTVTRDVRAVRSVYRIIPGYLAVKVLLGARSLSTLLASGPRLHDAPVPLLIQGARREGPSVTHITIKKTIMPRDRRRSVLQLRHVCMVVCACPQGLSYLHEQIPSSSSPPWPPSDVIWSHRDRGPATPPPGGAPLQSALLRTLLGWLLESRAVYSNQRQSRASRAVYSRSEGWLLSSCLDTQSFASHHAPELLWELLGASGSFSELDFSPGTRARLEEREDREQPHPRRRGVRAAAAAGARGDPVGRRRQRRGGGGPRWCSGRRRRA